MNAGREFLESWLEEPESASQAQLQQLAWYTIPYKGEGPRADLAEACAALLESTGRPRAAAAMRRHSPEVLAAWARSESAGFEAFVAADDATGVTPPDTPALAWAPLFGIDEFRTAVAEVAAAVLLTGTTRIADVLDAAMQAVAPSFRDPSGRVPDRDQLIAVLYDWIRPGTALGWLDRFRLDQSLTDTGRRAAYEGLVQRSHAPRSRP